MTNKEGLPVAIIGAGPIGLVAAAHLAVRGEKFIVLEAGEAVGASIRKWAHVRTFSPWSYDLDPVAVSLLKPAGWRQPDLNHLPSGQELVEEYLEPLAALPQLRPYIRLSAKVISITRLGFDKLKTDGREEAPFVLTVQTPAGEEEIVAKAVIDASGTYEQPNPLGGSGTPALGERTLSEHIYYGIPDVLGADRSRYAGRRVLVVGSGHSAFNALLELVELIEQEPATRVIWAVRRTDLDKLYGGFSKETLPARGNLGQRLRQVTAEGKVEIVTGFKFARLSRTGVGLIAASQERTLDPVDEIIATTGFRPDTSLWQELRVALDPALDSPVALADLIDPNVHTCGSVPVHGEVELRHPEKDFYILGMKSYGRAPTFLLRTGYAQVKSVIETLTGQVYEVEPVGAGAANSSLSSQAATSCCVSASTPTRIELVLSKVKSGVELP